MILFLGAMIGAICDEFGDMPNIEMPTFGGKFMWDTIKEADGWRIQVNKITGHARIQNQNDIRKAWGSE